MSGTGASQARGPSPSHAQNGRVEGQIVVLEGDLADNLIVSWWFHSRPCGVSSHVFVSVWLVLAL